MVAYCCVKGCTNNSNNKKKDPNSLLSFHVFPCNFELKSKWLKAIGRPNWVPPNHARICSMHFNPDQINYESTRTRMKDDAVPTINLPLNSNFEATNVEACRICLATDLKMYSLQDSQLSSCLDSVVGFNENYNVEGLPQYVCYQCAACLIRCNKLVEKSMTAQATLLDIFATNGQITKNLIKQLNRHKLNLESSLNCCQTKNYHYYKYNEESNIFNLTYSEQCTDNEIYLKNEIEDNIALSEIKTNTEDKTNKYDIELNETKLNDEEMSYSEEYLDISMDSSVGDPISDDEIDKTDENIFKCNNFETKRLEKRELKPLRKKSNGLTPDETNMQKYFDIIKLTFQEQIEEWRGSTMRRPLMSEMVYKCEVCLKLFAHINTYRVHFASHDPSRGKVECPVCKLRFKSNVLAKSHANRAHSKKFFCKACPKVFNNVGVAKKHQRWHSGYTYKCPSCPFSSAHESALGVHVRRAHAHSHACAVCGRACVSRRGLMLHKATAHRDIKESDISKAYRCEDCDIDFASEGARRVHLLTSSQHRKKSELCISAVKELRNTCAKCGVECSSKNDLITHIKAEHPRPIRKQWRPEDTYPTQCELCGETMTCRRRHWHHVRRHHPKEPDTYRPLRGVKAVCDTCGKGFQNSTKLHLHQLRHRAPTVRCDSCPRLFYDKYALARHASTHKANKPHQCRICGRAFKLRGNLERHARVHTDNAPYECTMCGKKFKYSSSVNLHVRTVHYKLPHPPRKKRSKSTRDTAENMGCL